MKTLRYQKLKMEGRRVEMWLLSGHGEGLIVAVRTARLIGKRDIKYTDEVYSIATFILIVTAWVDNVSMSPLIQDHLSGFYGNVVGRHYISEDEEKERRPL